MTTNTYQEYAELNAQIKELESKRDVLKDSILGDLVSSNAQTLKTGFGTFSIVERRTYVYSSKVKEQEVALKAMKRAEEESGAEAKVSISLRFQA